MREPGLIRTFRMVGAEKATANAARPLAPVPWPWQLSSRSGNFPSTPTGSRSSISPSPRARLPPGSPATHRPWHAEQGDLAARPLRSRVTGEAFTEFEQRPPISKASPDNLMHELKVERYYEPQTINGLVATVQGPIKTSLLRGVNASPT